MKPLLKLFLFILVLLSYFTFTLLLYPLQLFAPWRARKILALLVTQHLKVITRIFSINVKLKGGEYLPKSGGNFMVGNHLSYLDIMCIGKFIPICFVTSQEMKETFFLGQICTLAGCLFVERRTRGQLGQEVAQLTEGLTRSLNIMIFPESTSTNGESVLRFKRPLFQAPLSAGAPIIPITLNYTHLELPNSHQKVNISNRDYLFWYGDMDFFAHFLKFLTLKSASVEITLSPPLLFPTTASLTTISETCHALVSAQYQKVQGD